MRTVKNLSYLTLLAFFLVYCDFQPSGENFVVLPETDDSDMSIDLTNVTNDTLFLFTRTVLSYKSMIGTKQIKYFRAYLGDREVGASVGANGTFTIDARYIENGFYKLILEIHAGAGNGSLADAYGKEEFQTSRSWIVAIDNSTPDPVAFTTVRRNDGSLEIKWERYKKFNFLKYQIRKHPYNQGFNYYDNGWIKDITDINSTSLRDTTFIGGKVKYSIHVETDEKQSSWNEVAFEDPLDLDTKATWLDKNRIRVTWRKTPYYKNFREYLVNFSPNNADERTITKSILGDTSLIVDNVSAIFPISKTVVVSAYPWGVNRGSAGFVYKHGEAVVGTPFPEFTYPEIVFNSTLNKYFALRTYNNTLIRIDGTSHTFEQSVTITDSKFVLSDNGQHLYVMDGDLLKKLDPLTFTVTKTFDLSPFKASGALQWYLSVSNNDLLAASNALGGTFIFNMNSNALIQQLPFDDHTALSASGTYMVRNGKMWKWNGSEFAEAATFASTTWMSTFFKGDSKLIIAYAGTIKIMDLASFTFEKSLVSQVYDVKYDGVTDLISGRSSDGQPKMFFYSPTQTTIFPSFSSAGTVLLNGQLIASGRSVPFSYHYP